jgi:uncharacterized membrane protein
MVEAMQPGATDPSPIALATIAPNPFPPTLDERTMAILAHLLQIVGLWIAPLIIFVVKRESRFVSFHALQALLLQVLYLLLMGLGVVFWFGAVVLTMILHAGGNSSSPPAFFILMPMLWLDWMSIWGAMVVAAILYGVKAGRGEWAEYPYLGRLARRILKLGPDGSPQ